jgi:hypothetical protein
LSIGTGSSEEDVMVDARDLVVFASDAAFAVDENSRVVAWNRCAQDLLDYAPGHIPLAVDEAIRTRFPIRLPLDEIAGRSRRWSD